MKKVYKFLQIKAIPTFPFLRYVGIFWLSIYHRFLFINQTGFLLANKKGFRLLLFTNKAGFPLLNKTGFRLLLFTNKAGFLLVNKAGFRLVVFLSSN